MCRMRVGNNVLITTIYIVWIVISCSSLSYGDLPEVSECRGRAVEGDYAITDGFTGFRGSSLASTWYEVKISYPASIPASFSIQLKRGDLELPLNGNRRLLNTEKLIFKSQNDDWNDLGGMYVLVTVETGRRLGFVSIPNVQEKEDFIFNIVCDELLLGIPHQAWWVCRLCGGVLGFGLSSSLISSTLFVKSSRSECFERFLNMTPVVFEDHLMP